MNLQEFIKTALTEIGLLPVSRTPSLGVRMKPEVVHGDETDV
jgi:hypothetical protein